MRHDPSLRASKKQILALAPRRLHSVPYSPDLVFSRMQKGEPVIVDNLPVPVKGEEEFGMRGALERALIESFPRNRRISVRCGPSGTPKSLLITQLLSRWANPRARVNVTDLHIRGTGVFKRIDTSLLNNFNILAGAPAPAGREEMLTMVVSSAGSWSDSHTDDPDGSNHCFLGRKLWLVWDSFQGLTQGLEDVSRLGTSNEFARFKIAEFLSVPSSRWFVVEPGQTLFLPGNLAHRVITLDNYIGIGSFFVMLPSYLRTLIRWTRHTPLWALHEPEHRRLDLVDIITRLVIKRLRKLEGESEALRTCWGLSYLRQAVEDWSRTTSAQERNELLSNPVSAQFLQRVLANHEPRLPG